MIQTRQILWAACCSAASCQACIRCLQISLPGTLLWTPSAGLAPPGKRSSPCRLLTCSTGAHHPPHMTLHGVQDLPMLSQDGVQQRRVMFSPGLATPALPTAVLQTASSLEVKSPTIAALRSCRHAPPVTARLDSAFLRASSCLQDATIPMRVPMRPTH